MSLQKLEVFCCWLQISLVERLKLPYRPGIPYLYWLNLVLYPDCHSNDQKTHTLIYIMDIYHIKCFFNIYWSNWKVFRIENVRHMRPPEKPNTQMPLSQLPIEHHHSYLSVQFTYILTSHQTLPDLPGTIPAKIERSFLQEKRQEF